MNKDLPSFKFATGAFYLLVLVVSWMVIFYPPNNILSYDVFGYYMYLPFTFKYDDIPLHNVNVVEAIINKYKNSETFYQAFKYQNGNHIIRYPMGLAVLYAPFYFIGDLIAKVGSYTDDGFSKPYQFSILYGCLLYTIAGIWYLKKVLLHFFADKIAAVCMILLVLGTNYFFHTSIHGQGAMPHNMLFSLYAALMHYTLEWEKKKLLKSMILISLLIGIISLSRATEIICIIFPILFGIWNVSTLKKRWNEFVVYKNQILIGAALVFLTCSLQLMYYKFTAGKFFINTYGISNPGEGLEIKHPRLAEVLFSFRKGWLIYTPLMIFSLIGFCLIKKRREIFLPILFYFLINIWVVASWSCWWYADSFGQRALIPSMAIMCIPLGCFVERIFEKKITVRISFGILALFLIFLNLFQSWQIKNGILDTSNISKKFYFSTFLQTSPVTKSQQELLFKGKSHLDPETFTGYDSLHHALNFALWEDFEKGAGISSGLVKTHSHSGHFSLKLDSAPEKSFYIEIPMEKVSSCLYTWIKASCWVYSESEPDSIKSYFEIYMKHKDWVYKFQQYKITKNNIKKGCWCKLEYYYMTQDGLRTPKEKICIKIESFDSKEFYVDDMMIESYQPIIPPSFFY